MSETSKKALLDTDFLFKTQLAQNRKREPLIQMRNLKDGEIEEYEVSGDKIQGVYMKPGWTHNIINKNFPHRKGVLNLENSIM